MVLKSRSGSHGPTLQDILAVTGRRRRLGLRTSEEIGDPRCFLSTNSRIGFLLGNVDDGVTGKRRASSDGYFVKADDYCCTTLSPGIGYPLPCLISLENSQGDSGIVTTRPLGAAAMPSEHRRA
jgi:hypothetical protein